MGSEVKFRYGENVKNIAASKLEQGTFIYDKTLNRLYLYTPEGAEGSTAAPSLIPIG